jgi:hypothetical protein
MSARLFIVISLLLFGLSSARAADSCQTRVTISVKNTESQKVVAAARDKNTQSTVDRLNGFLNAGEQKSLEFCGGTNKHAKVSWEIVGTMVTGSGVGTTKCGAGHDDNLAAGATLNLRFESGCQEPGPSGPNTRIHVR